MVQTMALAVLLPEVTVVEEVPAEEVVVPVQESMV